MNADGDDAVPTRVDATHLAMAILSMIRRTTGDGYADAGITADALHLVGSAGAATSRTAADIGTTRVTISTRADGVTRVAFRPERLPATITAALPGRTLGDLVRIDGNVNRPFLQPRVIAAADWSGEIVTDDWALGGLLTLALTPVDVDIEAVTGKPPRHALAHLKRMIEGVNA